MLFVKTNDLAVQKLDRARIILGVFATAFAVAVSTSAKNLVEVIHIDKAMITLLKNHPFLIDLDLNSNIAIRAR